MAKQAKPPMGHPLMWMSPKANSDGPRTLSNRWFDIKASGEGSAEIFIYDEIGGWGLTAQQFARELKALGDIRNISLRIHSPGGDVFEGMAIYNLLDQHPAYITVHVDGLAASMASVIAMAGDNVIMPENAMMMVHKPWGIQGGDAEDMRRYAELLDKVEGALVSAYAKKTTMSEDAIAELLKEETWLTGREAVEQGFADTLASPLQMAASLPSNRLQEFTNMPDKLKNLMKPVAQGPTVIPPSPEEPTPSPEPSPSGATPSSSGLQARNNQIQDLFANFGGRHQDLMVEALGDTSMTFEQVKDKLLAKLGEGIEPSETPTPSAHIFVSNGNIVGDGLRAALMARCGHQADGSDDKANPYMSLSLQEMARASLTERKVGIAGSNRQQMVGMAFTHSSSDFGSILMDVAHKSMLQGWESSEETFDRWTYKGQLSDFKTAHRVGLGAFDSLRHVREGAEYKYVTVGDRGEPIALATYGELFAITRQTIINDDLQMLTTIPELMGEAAKATVGDLVYAILMNNPAMNDGKKLFHADHKNLVDASSGIDVGNLDKARTSMRQQKLDQRRLNIRPGYVLVPTAIESAMKQTIRSSSIKGADANSGVANPIKDFAEVIAEPRLDDQPTLDWYLAAARGRDTIEVAYLDGIDAPYIEQQEGFTTDGVKTKVRIDAGVAPRDYRGLVKATGTAK